MSIRSINKNRYEVKDDATNSIKYDLLALATFVPFSLLIVCGSLFNSNLLRIIAFSLLVICFSVSSGFVFLKVFKHKVTASVFASAAGIASLTFKEINGDAVYLFIPFAIIVISMLPAMIYGGENDDFIFIAIPFFFIAIISAGISKWVTLSLLNVYTPYVIFVLIELFVLEIPGLFFTEKTKKDIASLLIGIAALFVFLIINGFDGTSVMRFVLIFAFCCLVHYFADVAYKDKTGFLCAISKSAFQILIAGVITDTLISMVLLL